MAKTDPSKITTSDLTGEMTDYSVDTKATEGVTSAKESYYHNNNFTKWHGYYKEIPELKKAIDALATWTLGKGWTADARVTAILENIYGWGEDTFHSIMWNMLVIKKVNGDAYAEIIRNKETGELINLKVLDPASMSTVTNNKGQIIRYEQRAKGNPAAQPKKFQPQDILHLVNDRVADEIKGTSVVESCEEVILMRNQAMTDYKKVMHRNINPLVIFEVDTDDTTKINSIKTQYHNMKEDFEALFVPKGNMQVSIPAVSIQDPMPWIKYLENFFYQAVGVPKVITGGSEEFTEASSKIAYLTFEQIYAREQLELEADLWNQAAIRIKFNKPASLKSEMLQSEAKNTGQVVMQPNDMEAGRGADSLQA